LEGVGEESCDLSTSGGGRGRTSAILRLKALNKPAQGNALRNGIHQKTKP